VLSSSSAAAQHCTDSSSLTYAARTDPGLVRETNEDRLGIFPDLGLYLVADGMGGAAAGEVAANMAVELVAAAFVDPDATWPTGTTVPGRFGRETLLAAIKGANSLIHGRAVREFACRGMGTTIAAMLACGSHMALAHVGDSRIHLLRDGSLTLLTEDHSLWNEAVRLGFADPDHPEEFAYDHIITRNLGSKPEVEVDARCLEVALADTFLLCSDGLTRVVKASEIKAILLGYHDLDAAAARLVQRANELGGPDNITALLVRVG
jgi:protein phosphatase